MADDKPGRRAIRVAQILLLAGAAGLWGASRLVWVELRTFDGLGQPKDVPVSGGEWSSGLVPLAALLVATALAALAVRGWALRALALLVALSSLATGYVSVSTLEMADLAARAAELARVPLTNLVGSHRHNLGAVLTLAAAAVILGAAVLLMRAAATAGRTAEKYLAPAARRSAAQRGGDSPSERTMWDQLDAGQDPTDPDSEGR